MNRSVPLALMAAMPMLAQSSFRPPAVPLIAHDPYFSIWSMADNLTDENTKHWTGTEQPLGSLVRIDGQTFRLMGRDPRSLPAMTQKSVEVLPTRTIYAFEGAGVGVRLTFLTPALPNDLEVLSRPVTYVVWTVSSTDGAQHQVEVYFDASPALAVNTPEQAVGWGRLRVGGMTALRVGSQQQPVLEKDGDNLRIDWGFLYLAAPAGARASEALVSLATARSAFAASGKVPDSDDTETNRAVKRAHGGGSGGWTRGGDPARECRGNGRVAACAGGL